MVGGLPQTLLAPAVTSSQTSHQCGQEQQVGGREHSQVQLSLSYFKTWAKKCVCECMITAVLHLCLTVCSGESFSSMDSPGSPPSEPHGALPARPTQVSIKQEVLIAYNGRSVL